MKSTRIITALCALVLLLSACASNTTNKNSTTSSKNDSTSTTLSGTTSTTTNNEKPDDRPSIVPIIGGVTSESENYTVKEGGVVALEVRLSLPVAQIEDNPEVEAKLKERLTLIRQDLDVYISELETQYKEMISLGHSPLFTPRIDVSFELNYFTAKAMSLSFNITEVNGFGVTTKSSKHYNYEFDFASSISFGSAFEDRQGVINLLCSKASQRNDLYVNCEELISSLAETSWYISQNKIVFSFNPYAVAPASCGYVVFEFTKDELAPFVSDYGKDLFGF